MGRRDGEDARSPGRSLGERDDLVHALRGQGPQLRALAPRGIERDGARSGRGRDHHLTLPSGPCREPVQQGSRSYDLRGSEVALLERAARYRVVFSDDLRVEAESDVCFRDDVRSLERQGLLEHRTVTRLRDHIVADVIAVTAAGKALLDDHRDPQHDHGQIYSAGWVKPREVWHDASLYRMCREATLDVERAGGQVRRVVLDDELKARAYRALHELRSRDGESPHQHDAVAAVHGLHVEDGRFVFPDARLEVEDADGRVRSLDLELVTEHYHRGHLAGKARAGFRMFGSGSATTRGGTPRDEHAIERLLR